LTGAYSADGQTWSALGGSLQLKPNAKIGVMAAGDLGTTPVTAKVDWFHFSPEPATGEPVAPSDEFDGDALDGCRWSESVRYDSNHAAVADGHLKVTTQLGDINGNNPLSPRNFILTEAPEGDWVATTKFKAPLQHRYQLAGLMMWADDDNYVKADIVAYNAPGSALDLRAEMAAEANGAGYGSRNVNIADSTESGYWYVRVTKTGDVYTSEVSDGGVNWTPLGDTGITFDKPLRGLGLMAIGPQQEQPVVVEFDYFHLETEAPEPTLDVPVVASTRCIAGKVFVSVKATNNEAVPVALTFESAYGTKSFAEVAPGKNAVHAFTTRAVEIPAGTVTVTATATIDGAPVTYSVDAEYAAASCN
jgi:regulation of enolase protein 1 (concanavalin A-like superfamily)